MKSKLMPIYSVFAILAIALSVYACAYVSMSPMPEMNMSGVGASAGHIEHARSLTMAIVPTAVLPLLFSCFMVLAFEPFLLEIPLVFLYVISDTSPPAKRKLRQYFRNLRSPPGC